ncbi:hypothetical protein HK101_000542 [Irineochytrium annulatum]|nr:hypothetical protein HK101_000542 [Irineochytrium annulatum]
MRFIDTPMPVSVEDPTADLPKSTKGGASGTNERDPLLRSFRPSSSSYLTSWRASSRCVRLPFQLLSFIGCFTVALHLALAWRDPTCGVVRRRLGLGDATLPRYPKLAYPRARRVNVSEDVYGVKVEDPYRWMEDPFDPEVVEYVHEQDTLAKNYVRSLPEYQRFKRIYTETSRFTRYTPPMKHGEYWYYSINHGGAHNQNILYRSKDLSDPKPTMFLNPNTLSPNGVDQVDGWSFSPDGTLFAFVATKNETDYGWVGFLDVSTGERVDTELLYTVRYLGRASFEWTDKGVLYTAYPDPGLPLSDAGRNNDPFPSKLSRRFHKFNTSREADLDCGPADIDPTLPPEDPACRSPSVAAEVARDGPKTAWVPSVGGGKGKGREVRLVRQQMGGFMPYPSSWAAERGGGDAAEMAYGRLEFELFGHEPADAAIYVATVGDVEVYKTAVDAPRFRLIGVALAKGADGRSEAFELLGEHEEYVLDEPHVIDKNGTMLITYIADVRHVVQIFKNGTLIPFRELPLYDGACSNVLANPTMGIVTFTYDSLLDPGATYLYTVATDSLEVLQTMEAPASHSQTPVVEQMFFTSRDLTARVPMWTARDPSSVRKDGAARVWMTGYGGFMIARLPSFSLLALSLVRAVPGAMFVLVNLRGGKEYGTDWYDAGRNLNKINVFDDMIDAGRYLVAQGWTSPGLIGVQGASNGGLLAAAVAQRAPEIVGVSVADVGVQDILRFEEFTYGRYWVNDYGRSENETEALARLSWAPVTVAVRTPPGSIRFPPTFISTGDHDTRVSPLHSLKLAAAMQRVASGGDGGAPVILRVRELSGHNIFSSERLADAWGEKVAFWASSLGARVK